LLNAFTNLKYTVETIESASNKRISEREQNPRQLWWCGDAASLEKSIAKATDILRFTQILVF
jgi:hypothetical protein